MLEAIWASLDSHVSRLKSKTLFRGLKGLFGFVWDVLDFGLDFLVIAMVDFGGFGVVLRVFSLLVFSSLEFFGIFLVDFRDMESSLDSIYRSLFARFCGKLFDRLFGRFCGECRASRLWDRLASKTNSAEAIEAIKVMEAVINFMVCSCILFP